MDPVIDRFCEKYDSVPDVDISGQPPETLYHFTDAPGLVGIVQRHALWATRAFCLNDTSEVAHGMEVSHCVLERLLAATSSGSPERTFRESTLNFLNPANIIERRRVDIDPYVVSFCADADTSVHWLHYGRSGRGYAIGFNTTDVAPRDCGLRRVLYDQAEQETVVEMTVLQVEKAFLDAATESGVAHQFAPAASHACVARLRSAFAFMKHPAFENEKKWRLVYVDVRGPLIPPNLGDKRDMLFRTVGDRVVPYYEIRYSDRGSLPIRSIVLGSQLSVASNERNLRLLLDKAKVPGDVDIRGSSVPVR